MYTVVWQEARGDSADVLADLTVDVTAEWHSSLQATYAYMKAAYLSMLSPDDRLTFGESEIALFRFVHHPAASHDLGASKHTYSP